MEYGVGLCIWHRNHHSFGLGLEHLFYLDLESTNCIVLSSRMHLIFSALGSTYCTILDYPILGQTRAQPSDASKMIQLPMLILYQVASLLQHVKAAEHGVPPKVQTHGYVAMIRCQMKTQYSTQYCTVLLYCLSKQCYCTVSKAGYQNPALPPFL